MTVMSAQLTITVMWRWLIAVQFVLMALTLIIKFSNRRVQIVHAIIFLMMDSTVNLVQEDMNLQEHRSVIVMHVILVSSARQVKVAKYVLSERIKMKQVNSHVMIVRQGHSQEKDLVFALIALPVNTHHQDLDRVQTVQTVPVRK